MPLPLSCCANRCSAARTPGSGRRATTSTWSCRRPIIAGAGQESNALGYLAIGKRIDDSFAKQLGSFAGSEVLLTAGKRGCGLNPAIQRR